MTEREKPYFASKGHHVMLAEGEDLDIFYYD